MTARQDPVWPGQTLRPHRIIQPERVIATMRRAFPHVSESQCAATIRRVRWAGTDWEGDGAQFARIIRNCIRNRHTN